MPFFFPPPPPFTGGAQPYAPRQGSPGYIAAPVNPPPTTLGGPAVAISEVAFLAAPNPYVPIYMGPNGQPFEPNLGNPSGLNNPPMAPPPGAMAPVVQFSERAWLPDPWVYDMTSAQPYAPKVLSPGIPGQTVDNPPFVYPGRTVWYQSAMWDARQGGIGAEDPWNRWPYVFLGWQGPFMPRHSDPNDLNNPPQNPPFTSWVRTRPQPPVLVWVDPTYYPPIIPTHIEVIPEVGVLYGHGYIIGE